MKITNRNVADVLASALFLGSAMMLPASAATPTGERPPPPPPPPPAVDRAHDRVPPESGDKAAPPHGAPSLGTPSNGVPQPPSPDSASVPPGARR